MPRFAANLSWLYQEFAFLDRLPLAREDGFEAVECLFPYAIPLDELARSSRSFDLRWAVINAPPGDWDQGERGLAALPGREKEFRDGFLESALPYATALGCPRIHIMAGCPGSDPETVKTSRSVYFNNLTWAAEQAQRARVGIVIEPINPWDMPGYFLSHQSQAQDLVEAIGVPNLGVQMDLYHAHRVEGDLATQLRRWLPSGRVHHLQVAGHPGRHEPDLGEIRYPELFGLIDDLGYPGYVGCEYRPRTTTREGLGWLLKKSPTPPA